MALQRVALNDMNSTLVTPAARAVFMACVARNYSEVIPKYYLNCLDDQWHTASISFRETSQTPLAVERFVDLAALELVASKQTDGSCLIETMSEAHQTRLG